MARKKPKEKNPIAKVISMITKQFQLLRKGTNFVILPEPIVKLVVSDHNWSKHESLRLKAKELA